MNGMGVRRGVPVLLALTLSLSPVAVACGGDDGGGQEQDGGQDEGDNGGDGGGNGGPYGQA